MGMLEVKVRLASLAAPDRSEEVSLIVDTGATLSWIPRSVLENLGATVFSRLPFELADGRRLDRDVTTVLLTVDDKKAPVPMAFGERGEESVLGAAALESLGFMVDPVAQKLVPRNLRLLYVTQSLTSGLVTCKKSSRVMPCAKALEGLEFVVDRVAEMYEGTFCRANA
ncbi:MAG TPA: aspartyl protease family protein [Candidatus Acidoferrales bacterium]|nr:aspartyl protease family protein [Candidatus Acidoferrales bacterium]